MLRGYVDPLGRPVVRLRLLNLEDDRLCLVDTGCNVGLVVSSQLAREAALDIAAGRPRTAQFADGVARNVLQIIQAVELLGRALRVEILIVPDPARASALDDLPTVIIGTELLGHTVLEIDFPRRTVVIRRAA